MSSARKMSFIQPANSLFEDSPMSREQYEFFASKMYELSGVNLPYSPKNDSLVKNRIFKLMRETGIFGYDPLISALKNADARLTNQFISCLTTNKTHFFREELHFNWLRQYLSGHFAKNSELRIWCAAASTGQEPYTLAILLNECLNSQDIKKTRFLATDIDHNVLRKAAQGVYREAEMDGCPTDLRLKYFNKKAGSENTYRAKDELSQLIRFAPFNLVQDRYPFQHKFHIIFCRNVLIYFDPDMTKKVIQSLIGSLNPGGYLVLGHSEAGSGKVKELKQVSQAIFQKVVREGS